MGERVELKVAAGAKAEKLAVPRRQGRSQQRRQGVGRLKSQLNAPSTFVASFLLFHRDCGGKRFRGVCDVRKQTELRYNVPFLVRSSGDLKEEEA